MAQQKTIKSPIHFSGIGIHSGNPVSATIFPAPANTGFVFVRLDQNNAKIPASPDNLSENLLRATRLCANGVTVDTPEHILAALYGLGVSNAIIELDAPEVPILDGSAAPFCQELLKVGLEEQGLNAIPIQITDPIIVEDGPAQIVILPCETFKITYILEYDDAVVGQQTVHFTITPDTFADAISPARTFGFTHEIDALRKAGLAKGGRPGENAILISEHGYDTPIRFENECATHKVLDIIGDFAILARPLNGHIMAIRSGHALNAKAVQAIQERC
ncbi:MAG: UDP-3-O-acyl-N-acetylglucosamine deacetylase [bacterium]|nr:UDP-3-O-acyl-N-acetylglucosamine deacetylase [bacterium]